MGMNIHICAINGEIGDLTPLTGHPKDGTLPRYVGQEKFMSLLWQNGIYYMQCERCRKIKEKNEAERCDYYCDSQTVVRPENCQDFREKIKHLEYAWMQELVDYLEANPCAYIEFD